MRVIIHNVKSNKLDFWIEVPSIDRFKKIMSVDSPELDFYQVLDFTKEIKGSEFEIFRNEIITRKIILEEVESETDILPWYKHSEITRSFLYNDQERYVIKFILDNYGDAVWHDIENGVIPKPEAYPIIPAKIKKIIEHVSKKVEVQRIRVKEV
jgi:hypothetical protein